MSSQDRTENGTGVTHDPLCPDYICICALIAKVREDERDNAWSSVAEIHAIELWDGVKTAWWIVKADALTAIAAIKGEKP